MMYILYSLFSACIPKSKSFIYKVQPPCFIHKYIFSRVQLVVKGKEVSHFSWLWPLTPFSAALWGAVLTFITSVSMILHLSLWTARRMLPHGKQPQQDFLGNFLYIYGFFCCQGHYRIPVTRAIIH